MTLFHQYTFEEVKGYYLKNHKDSKDARKNYYLNCLHNIIGQKIHIPDRGDVKKIIQYFLLEGEE